MDADLDSATQGTFFLARRKRKQPEDASPPPWLDDWRRSAYRASWAKHQARIDDTLRRQTRRSSEAVVHWVSESYPVDEPKKPYASIPTALISSTSIQTLHSLIANVELLLSDKRRSKGKGRASQEATLESEDVDMDQATVPSGGRRTVIECKTGMSLETLVESIVLGLLGDDPSTGSTPTLPSLLRFQDGRVKLSITLHQIHLLPLRTLTSFLSVLTRYSPRLNLVLILTTASASGVLREVVPSSVMEALDMRVFEGVEGGDLWEEVIRDLYFSSWEPDVLIDGTTFDELREEYDRNSHSVECLISSLQYIHFKTFFGPLGQFVRPLPEDIAEAINLFPSDKEQLILKRLLSLPSILQFTFSARNAALRPPTDLLFQNIPDFTAQTSIPSADFPRHLVKDSLVAVHKHASDRRMAFAIFASARNYLAGRKVDGGSTGGGILRVRGGEAIRLMRNVVDGDAAGTEKGFLWTCKLISKLPVSEIAKLAEGVRVGVQSFTPSQRAIPLGELSRVKDSPSQTAEVLETMLRRWISPHEDVPFHEIYYFQGLKDLIKVFRPAPLEAIQTGLLSPQTYLGKSSCDPADPTTLPDTTLLFLRYLESGKMINLYDWFDAFSSTLRVPSPSAKDSDDEVEKRKEVQARFMRGFHELDFLGFLKGTKRKQDHVLKTFFMLGEEETEGFLDGLRAGRRDLEK